MRIPSARFKSGIRPQLAITDSITRTVYVADLLTIVPAAMAPLHQEAHQ